MSIFENTIARVEAAIVRAQAEQVAANAKKDRGNAAIASGKELGLHAALAIFKNELRLATEETPPPEPEPEPVVESHAFDVQFNADGFDWFLPVLAPSADDVRREFEARATEFGWSMEGLVITEARA